jgi:hypothetical protein
MDELLKTVQDKTGLDLEQAQGAIEAVLGFIKDKLPGPIASQLEGLIGGGDGDGDGGGLMDKLGDLGKGLLGGN